MDSNVIKVHIVTTLGQDIETLIARYPLGAASLERLQRRHNFLAQQHFRISRALIQQLASKAFNSSPPFELLETATGPKFQEIPDYHISLSHSHHFVAVCINPYKFAIDIEQVIKPRPYLKIAQFAFHREEYDWLTAANTSATLRDQFYQLWTARECFYKLGLMQTLADQSFSTFAQKTRSQSHCDYLIRDDLYLACVQSTETPQAVQFIFE